MNFGKGFVESVKCDLNCASFVYEKWVSCECLCLFDNCLCEFCVNIFLKIFVTVVTYERYIVVCLRCNSMLVEYCV